MVTTGGAGFLPAAAYFSLRTGMVSSQEAGEKWRTDDSNEILELYRKAYYVNM
jgi:hypothetical protein